VGQIVKINHIAIQDIHATQDIKKKKITDKDNNNVEFVVDTHVNFVV